MQIYENYETLCKYEWLRSEVLVEAGTANEASTVSLGQINYVTRSPFEFADI